MKETDDTPMPENESETRRETDELLFECIKHLGDEIKAALADRDEVIRGLMLRVADLETQRTANESNQDDPEWYS